MPKASILLLTTDREIKAASSRTDRTDYRIRGAPGLQMRVTAAGSKTLALAYKSPATGKWAKVALGKYPSMSLAEARDRAIELGAEVRKGRDPIHDKRQEALVETFATLAARYMREHEARNSRAGVRSRSTKEAQRILDVEILPNIGRLRAEVVTRQHVMRVVEAVADRGAYVAADRTLGLVRTVYNWACGTGRLDRNPTLGLKKRNAGRARMRVLTPNELRIFWDAIGDPGSGITPPLRDAYRLQLLTGARIGEVLGALRYEVDLQRGTWTIGASRTKSAREYLIPFSTTAVAVFREAVARCDEEESQRTERLHLPFEPSKWVFPSPRGRTGPIDPHAATTGLLRMRSRLAKLGIAEPFNTHDLRRTVATSLGELGVAEQVIERILNHAPRTIAGKHYNHAQIIGPVRHALETWAHVLTSIL